MLKTDKSGLSTGYGLRLGIDLMGKSEDCLLGSTLGQYRLVEVIGEGGMSRIYRGERADGNFEHDVAVKVSMGASISAELRRRFDQELSLLAALDHPNITRLYDAQVSVSGRPYMVMELIRGESVDAYCDSRGNPVSTAVTLLQAITAAVAYAHAHLIVHRDIKPGNVMVDWFDQPKLLDFGIAKLLVNDTDSGTAIRAMTPHFASPEQLLGKPVTIASDIFQLGALLYRLLTGQSLLPPNAIEQAIAIAARGEDLSIPPKFRRSIPRDLQLIVERCLRAEPQARYPSADALARDLAAFQGDYPVSAASRSGTYLAGRFLKRHRTVASVIAAAGIVLMGITFSYTRSLSKSEELAEARAASATRASKALSRLLTESMSDLQDHVAEQETGSAAIVKSVFEDAIRLASQELASDDATLANLIRIRANAEWRLGRLKEAKASFREATVLASAVESPDLFTEIQLDTIQLTLQDRQVVTADEVLGQLTRAVAVDQLPAAIRARYLRTLGYLAYAKDEFEVATNTYLQAMEILEGLGSAHDRERADVLTSLAWVEIGREDFEMTRDYAQAAVDLLEKDESPMSHRFIDPLRTLALALGFTGEYSSALQVNERALRLANANYGQTHRTVGRVHSSLSSLFYRRGDIHRAITHEEEAQRIEQALYGGDSWDSLVSANTLVLYLGEAGRIPEALAASESLLAIFAAREGPEGRRNLEVLLANQSRFLIQAGAVEEGVAASRRSLALRQALHGEGSYGDYDSQRFLSYALVAAGQIDEAKDLFDTALAGLIALRGRQNQDFETWSMHQYLLERANGNLRSAREYLERYFELIKQQQVLDSPHFLTRVVDLADIQASLGDVAGASRALKMVSQTLTRYPNHPDVLRAKLIEADLLVREKRAEEAIDLANAVLLQLRRDYPRREDLLKRAEGLSGGAVI
ncbi:MAG: protein kinase [Pseudomonadota bacterium]